MVALFQENFWIFSYLEKIQSLGSNWGCLKDHGLAQQTDWNWNSNLVCCWDWIMGLIWGRLKGHTS
jgi:hypothetical protein